MSNRLRAMSPRAALDGAVMMASALLRKISVMLAVAACCAVLAGCVSDLTAVSPSQGNQLRYYGGPKSPMWPSE